MHNQPREPQPYDLNLGELHKEWTEAGVKASRATTHRRVKEFGYSCHQRRLTWAKEKKNWTVTQWSKVLFSDESKFCISFGNQGPRVWRKGGEVAWSPVLSFHSLWWFGVQCHLLVLVHVGVVFWKPTSLHPFTKKFWSTSCFFRLRIRWCILYSSIRLARSIFIAKYNCEQASFPLSLFNFTFYAALMQSRSRDLALMLPTLVRALFLNTDSEESCSRWLLCTIILALRATKH